MDHHHHHHHQQQQWRPMPIPGNICPTCSNSHFPFCPPFNQIQNPRPQFDPHLLPAGPPRPPWHRSPSLDREPYNQFQLQQSYSNGFANESDRNSKRPRVDDMQSNNHNSVRFSSDIERRLKLIRDHGSSLGGPMPGMNSHETNRYVQESLGFDGNYGKFDGSWESRSELGPMGVRNLEMNNFHDPRFGPGDRVGQPYMQSNRNGFHNEEEFVHSSRYGISNVDQAPPPPPPPPPHISQRVPPYPGSEVANDHYHNTHNPQWRQGSDSVTESELKYSHMNNWHGPSVMYPEQRGSVAMDNRGPKNQQQQQFYGKQYPVDTRQPLDVGFQSRDGNRGPIWHHSMPGVTQHGAPNLNERGGYFQSPSGGSMVFENTGQMEASRFYSGQPPIPASPPPPLPFDPTFPPSSELKAYSSPPKTTASLFPVAVSSSAMVPTSYQPIPKAHSLSPPPYYHNKPLIHASTGFFSEAVGDGQPFSLKQLSSDKPKVIDASHLFKRPHRATRPDHIVIILRGLPGSGKSYLAKMLRDLEVENGGHAPRIHSMDDYFMTEVEKIEEGDASKSSVRGKKPIMKKVMEYCYEPEMEEAYRSSMLKAFKKTLEEGGFTFIIVDDRNLRVADFAQFWAIGKSSGYEVYILEATYKDPAGCAARNVHGFTQDDVEKMARQWEEASSLYLQLDVKTLFHGDDLKESGIQEVEMDMEDEDVDGNLSGLQERMPENNIVPPLGEDTPDDSSKDGNRWDSQGDHLTEEVKELGRSKWSDDLDEENTERTERVKGNVNALSGLIQAYGKGAKSVRWADKVGNTGFSLHAAKKADVSSIVIGPGTGYNLKSNPLREETPAPSSVAGESKRQSIFQERLRAERESFKLVFDRRRQRIGLGLEEE